MLPGGSGSVSIFIRNPDFQGFLNLAIKAFASLCLAALWRGKFCVGLVCDETAYCLYVFLTRNKGKS